MQKLKLMWLSDALFLKTGLSRNVKALFKEFYKHKDKYELVHYCSNTSESDHHLDKYPWKSIGAVPSNSQDLQQLQSDPHLARIASYGGYKIDKVIKEEKPDILVCSNDIWSFPPDRFCQKEWAKTVNVISHITVDSVPILDEAIEQAKNSHFFSWAKFGEDEVRKKLEKQKFKSDKMLGTINGAVDITNYQPISQLEKMELRRKFNIPQDCKLFFYLGRNQLRKKYDSLLRAFDSYRKQYPNSKAKLLLHCSFVEGWPLKRMIDESDIDPADVLVTHVCSHCKEFLIKSYEGENQPCPYCGNKNTLNSVNITNGVADEDMSKIYGIADACISLFTSGGFEYVNAESMLCGIPLATVEYSCGSEYTPCKDVYKIDHTESGECGSGFIKCEPNVQSVIRFMKKIEGTSEKDIREIGKRSREWAVSRFDSRVIARQWMDVFDKFEKVDYSSIGFDDTKNPDPNFTPDFSLNGQEFIKHLYSGYLDAQHPDEQGMNHWCGRLDNQEPKSQIASIFQQIAAKDAQPKGVDIKDLLLKNDKKNLFFVLKESLGDCIISLSLLEGARLSYPNHNINIVTEPKFFEVFRGCEFVDNLIPYNPILEQEMYIIGAGQEESIGDVFVMPAVATQKHLNYLSNNNPELLRNQWKTKDQMEELHKLGINCDINGNPIIDWALQTK